jgi:hypothetical protein
VTVAGWQWDHWIGGNVAVILSGDKLGIGCILREIGGSGSGSRKFHEKLKQSKSMIYHQIPRIYHKIAEFTMITPQFTLKTPQFTMKTPQFTMKTFEFTIKISKYTIKPPIKQPCRPPLFAAVRWAEPLL